MHLQRSAPPGYRVVSTIALDVDLHRIHAYSDRDGRVCYNATEWPWSALHRHSTILVEVASPVDTSHGDAKAKRAQAYNRRKWAIGNSVQVGRLIAHCETHDMLDKVWASPANIWTGGYNEIQRETMAGCLGQDNHDIRACRSMLFFHQNNKKAWVPIMDWLRDLSKKKTKKK